ncbi:methyltransferase domain-containing protein [Fulvivirgaceae bacterium PWU4]|uniref:Methyltransferase domain-containing protein n=1 Tax=Chryseosolibacter histidini TaxID=2782349 RepID=A0AAP2GJ67_9BACT|nr:methyltransferase domain-containing protein [Chryseosolibacter histidini]
MAENLLEWLALKANLAPVPLVHTQVYFVFSRAILSAFNLEIFETMKRGPQTLHTIATTAGLDQRALRSLLEVLVAAGYLRYHDERYSLTRLSRKWCLKDSASGVAPQQEFNRIAWQWMDHLDVFLKTGASVRFHESFGPVEWKLYMEGMECLARSFSKTAVAMAPDLSGASAMLDVGGAHGIYAAAFCEKYPSLKATILDLPEAVETGSLILKKYYNGNRIVYRKGDATRDDFGEQCYDLVFVANVIHHLSDAETKELAAKARKALRVGGYLIIHEYLAPEGQGHAEITAATLNLFFGLTSASGCRTEAEIRKLCESGELKFLKSSRFIGTNGYAQMVFSRQTTARIAGTRDSGPTTSSVSIQR